jgi:hypothetical protein
MFWIKGRLNMTRMTRLVLTLWTVLIILVATMSISGSATAGYVKTSSTDGYATPLYYDSELPVGEIEWGSYTANVQGTASCTADAWSEAKPGSADASASAWGTVMYTWEWQGPPSTPPGGTLEWENDGDGNAMVDGRTDLSEGGSAATGGYAGAGTTAAGDSWSSTSGWVWGHVEDKDDPSGTADASGYPEESLDPYEDVHPTQLGGDGWFYFDVYWNGLYQTEDEIPSGTATFYAWGDADCYASSGSTATSTADAWTDSDATASVCAYASFTPNP